MRILVHAIVQVLLLTVALASAAAQSGSPGISLNFLQTGRVRGTQVSPADIQKLSDQAQQAVKSADAAPAGSNVAVVLQDAYVRLRGNASDSIGFAYIPTTDPVLLSNPVFAANLRTLFEKQAQSANGANNAPGDVRVVGGSPIKGAKNVVSVNEKLDEKEFGGLCSGVLLDPTHVLTAAHCKCLGYDVRVQTGSSVFGDDPAPAYIVDVDNAIIFDDTHCPAKDGDLARYEASLAQTFVGKDLAILPLTRPIAPQHGTVSPVLGPRGVAAWLTSANNYFIRVGGFGFQKVEPEWPYRPTSPGTLIFADLAISSPVCSASDQAELGCAPGLDLVAGANPALQTKIKSVINTGTVQDTCQGDSGGPAYAKSDANGGGFFLVGVTSGGVLGGHCGSGSIYTLLRGANVIGWLSKYGARITE